MTTMSVPSTLVKCLYLFFDLPHMPEVPAATQTELPLGDRRALLQKVFVQVSCLDIKVIQIILSLMVECCVLVIIKMIKLCSVQDLVKGEAQYKATETDLS